jgi:uncharacterized membrane protein
MLCMLSYGKYVVTLFKILNRVTLNTAKYIWILYIPILIFPLDIFSTIIIELCINSTANLAPKILSFKNHLSLLIRL